MILFENTTEFNVEGHTAVAIGKFDGIHVGHKKLLEEILAAKKDGLLACVFTFDPPPAVLFGFSDGKELTTKEEKRTLFEQMGVDILVEFPLSYETAAISPEAFVNDILAEGLKVRYIAAGADVSFGDKGAGNALLLQKMGENLGFEVKIIDKITRDGKVVSSTLVREYVEAGQMPEAEILLGEPYFVQGEIVHGKQLGRTLGFPTVNIIPGATKLAPPYGVYYSRVLVDGRWYRGISNIGCKPTVADKPVLGVETYLYDFDGDLYGKNAKVCLLRFKRPEQKFASLDELIAQLRQDIRDGEKFAPEIDRFSTPVL